MKIIGITGNIASGKSTISKIIANHYDIPLVAVDRFSRNYMLSHSLIFRTILKNNGLMVHDMLEPSSVRDVIKTYFFEIPLLKAQVEEAVSRAFWNYIHGEYVFGSAHNPVASYREHYKYIIIEHPILFEQHQESNFDYIIGVTASDKIRVERMEDRGYTDDEILNFISVQTPLYANKDKCDLILDTSDNPIKKQIIDELSNSREFKAIIS